MYYTYLLASSEMWKLIQVGGLTEMPCPQNNLTKLTRVPFEAYPWVQEPGLVFIRVRTRERNQSVQGLNQGNYEIREQSD